METQESFPIGKNIVNKEQEANYIKTQGILH